MEVFKEFLERIDNQDHRARTEEVLGWILKNYPNLIPVVKWNQPMFSDHGTFIIGFSVSKQHMAVSPERAGVIRFSDEIAQTGYEHTENLVRIPWKSPVDFSLLERMIEFNILDKAECTTFWRK